MMHSALFLGRSVKISSIFHKGERREICYLSDKDLEETSDSTADAVLGSLLGIARHGVCVYRGGCG